MNNLKTTRVIYFCEKIDEWPIWSEKLLAKAKAKTKTYGFKHVMEEKLSISMADVDLDKVSDLGKKMSRSIILNEINCTELIISIDVSTSQYQSILIPS
jgi:hypothetical protein